MGWWVGLDDSRGRLALEKGRREAGLLEGFPVKPPQEDLAVPGRWIKGRNSMLHETGLS